MIAMILVGGAMGAVAFGLLTILRPPRVSPLVLLGRFDAARQPLRDQVYAPDLVRKASPDERLGRFFTTLLARRGVTYTSLRQDLALTGRTLDVAMGRKVVSAVAGFLIAMATIVFLQFYLELGLPFGSPAVVALLVGLGFFFLPDIEARQQASKRRREFRRAFGAYLDLVSLEMSGAAAPESALPAAAKIGGSWPLVLLHDTLYQATLAGEDPWQALSDLGKRIGVDELRELGRLVHLVANDGAKVRQTLVDRATSLRRQELAEQQGTAGERDQSMRMAQILIGFGFVVFVGYPAVGAILFL